MNILYISTVFPKKEENSTIYTDLAEALVNRGHHVTVVAAEERKKSEGTHLGRERGCTVLRIKTGNMYDVNFIEKGISILTLEICLRLAIVRFLTKETYDLILFEAPPVTLSGVVKTAKRIYGAPAFLMMKDIFPQNAVDIGIMKKGSLLERFFLIKEKKLYRVADHIGCMSEGNLRYLEKNKQISEKKLSIFPNTKKIQSQPVCDITIRERYGIPKDKVVFIFGGNMGKPQGMEFLAEAVRQTESIEKAFFVFVGRGTERVKVSNILKGSYNALILDNLPREKYEMLITSCDVGIVSLDCRFTIPNYPSRVLSYMEYGMPVLAATDDNTDFRNLIEESGCGYWCSSDDIVGFVTLVKRFCDCENRESMGIAGRKYVEEHFTVERSVDLLEEFYDRY